MSDDEDEASSISVMLMLYAVWCLLVFVMFLVSAWFAWDTDTMTSHRESGGAYVSGPNHK